jgi:hypothetical protein
MAKILLIVTFLLLGVMAGIYLRPDRSDRTMTEADSTPEPSSIEITEARPLEKTPAVTNLKDTKINTLLKQITSKDTKTAIELSFGHPLERDSKAENGYEKSIQKLNQDPQKSLNEISKLLIGIGTSNDGIRTHLLNLAMQTSAAPQEKGEFIKDYLTQAQFNMDKDGLADDSYSAVVAIDYLAQNFQNEGDVQALVGEILTIKDEKVRNEMKVRLAIHYPGII